MNWLVNDGVKNNYHHVGDSLTSYRDVTSAVIFCQRPTAQNLTPYPPHPAPPSPESGIYLKSTVYSCWFMAFKKEGLWYPCQLRAPRVAVPLAGSWLSLRQDHYSSSFHTAHSQVHFLRQTLSTCRAQNTLSFCFPPNTGCRLKYKV